jgi:hypothetical protein
MTFILLFFSDIFRLSFSLVGLASGGFLPYRCCGRVCLGLRMCGSILVSALSSLGGNVSSLVLSGVVSVLFGVSVGMRRIVLRVCCSMLWLALVVCLFDFSFLHLRVSCIGILDSWFVCGDPCRDMGKTINLLERVRDGLQTQEGKCRFYVEA